MAPITYTPYAPRPPRFLGYQSMLGWRFKVYHLAKDSTQVIEHNEQALAWQAISDILRSPEPSEGRPGVGFAIFHYGRVLNYFVLGLWNNENELITHVLVQSHSGDLRPWHPGTNQDSFCVWDLGVIWHERNAYIATLLSGEPLAAACTAYLEQIAPS